MYAISKLNTAINQIMNILNHEVFEKQPPETKISVKLSYNDRWFYLNCVKEGVALPESITVNTKTIKYKSKTDTEWQIALDFRQIDSENDSEIIQIINDKITELMQTYIVPNLNPNPVNRTKF